MTTTEKLQRIRARCVELLEIASKRTPGEWGYYWGWDLVYSDANGERKIIADCVDRKEPTEQVRDDMAFIASCAGNAEAGWRNTIGRIDFCGRLREYATSDCPWLIKEIEREEDSAIESWEIAIENQTV